MTLQVFCLLMLCVLAITSGFKDDSQAEYAIRKVQETQVGLKRNGTHHLLAYADDVNLLGDNIDTIKKKTRKL
jgi:hypothetical protein